MHPGVQHQSWSDVKSEDLNPLLRRQYVSGDQAMLSRIELKKGCVVPRHVHPNEQISFITEGAIRFSIGEQGAAEQRVVRAGEVLVIPKDVPHGAEALEDTINYDVFAPPRHDWMNGDDDYLR